MISQNGVITKAQTDGLALKILTTHLSSAQSPCLGWLLTARQTPSYTRATNRATFDPSNGASVCAPEATRILSPRFRRCSVNCPPSPHQPTLHRVMADSSGMRLGTCSGAVGGPIRRVSVIEEVSQWCASRKDSRCPRLGDLHSRRLHFCLSSLCAMTLTLRSPSVPYVSVQSRRGCSLFPS
jgi:hypothetical protein